MATKNSKAVKAIEAQRAADPGFVVDEAPESEQFPSALKRTRQAGATTVAATEMIAQAHATMADGVSRTYRVGGEKAEALISALRRVAADNHNMTVRTAPSAQAGFTLWQLVDKAPTKRTRTKKAEG